MFSVLETYRFRIDRPLAEDSQLMTKGIVQVMPAAYVEQIRQLPGVAAATGMMLMPIQGRSAAKSEILAGVDAAGLLQTFSGLGLSKHVQDQWLGMRLAALSDANTAARHGWKVNDRLALQLLPGQRTRNGSTYIEAILVGIYEPRTFLSGVIIHYDYLVTARATRVTVGNIFVRTERPEEAGAVARRIDAKYFESEVATETAPINNYARQTRQNARGIQVIIGGTLGAAFFTMLLITANTLAQSVRERMGEMAVLRVVGFHMRHIFFLVTAESLTVLIAGGALGLGIGQAALAAGVLSGMPAILGLSWHTAAVALVLALAFSMMSIALPAWELARMRIADALHKL
jgi:putative ABC transport system permease protein